MDRDGAGRFAVTLEADPELVRRADATGVDLFAELVDVGERAEAEGWRLTDVQREDGSRVVTLARRFADPDELNRLLDDLATALQAPEGTLLESFRLEVTDDHVLVAGVAALIPGAGIADLGLDPQDATRLLEQHNSFRYEVRVALPGEVLSTTADEAREEGGVLVWKVPIGSSVPIQAVSTRPTTPVGLVAAVAGAGLVFAAVGAWALRGRRDGSRRRPSASASDT